MILVTGGAGYIGSHFVKRYLDWHSDVDKILVVDNLSEGHIEALSEHKERVEFIRENIGNIDAMKALFRRFPVETVVHFAASCYVGESNEKPGKYFHNNTINSLNLFRAMEECNVKNILFSSTCATYGDPEQIPIDESHPFKPINIYGLTKLMIEMALKGYSETLGWSYIALRYFNVAGADNSGTIGEHHEPEPHLIPIILQAALGQRPIMEINGNDYDTRDGTCIRDYVHVMDLANAHCLALEHLKKNRPVREAINIGTTHGASVNEVIELCREITGKEISTRYVARRDGDPAILVANPAKAKALLGWQPEHNLRDIIESAWAWEQNRRY